MSVSMKWSQLRGWAISKWYLGAGPEMVDLKPHSMQPQRSTRQPIKRVDYSSVGLLKWNFPYNRQALSKESPQDEGDSFDTSELARNFVACRFAVPYITSCCPFGLQHMLENSLSVIARQLFDESNVAGYSKMSDFTRSVVK